MVAEGSLIPLAKKLSADDLQAPERRAAEYVADPDDITEV
jgi:hypothetical protein